MLRTTKLSGGHEMKFSGKSIFIFNFIVISLDHTLKA